MGEKKGFCACHCVIVRGIQNLRVVKEELLKIPIFSKGIQVRGVIRVNFILSLIGMLNRVTMCINFILSLIGMLNRVTLRVNFILSLIGMLNRVTLRVNFTIKFDWHAKFSMIMHELFYSI